MSEPTQRRKRILLFGATGTIGRATARALVERGHQLVAFVRPQAEATAALPPGADLRVGDVTDPASVVEAFRGDRPFGAVISCLASRTGLPEDARAIDHRANLNILEAAKAAGVPQMILLSALCVQKPRLAFQQAKLAFERDLRESGLVWSIVRPTAFFKSLVGQVERVRAGKPYLIFGDGRLTACKPISDGDLADYLADCLDDPALHNRILPIGGPGPAITPREQGERLFALLGREPRFRDVRVGMLDAIIAVLGFAGRFSSAAAAKAELARIGRYYATESMLVWDEAAGRYDAAATPEYGSQTLFDYMAALVRGEATAERGDHAVF